MKHYFAFVSRNRYIVQKKLKNIVVLGLKSKKVYETINSELSILGLFNHNRELLAFSIICEIISGKTPYPRNL